MTRLIITIHRQQDSKPDEFYVHEYSIQSVEDVTRILNRYADDFNGQGIIVSDAVMCGNLYVIAIAVVDVNVYLSSPEAKTIN